jgi:hypothetical protein
MILRKVILGETRSRTIFCKAWPRYQWPFHQSGSASTDSAAWCAAATNLSPARCAAAMFDRSLASGFPAALSIAAALDQDLAASTVSFALNDALPASRSSSTAAWSSVVAASSSLESSEELMCTACLNNLFAACCSARLYCLSSKAWSRAAALCAEEANDRSFPAVIRPGGAPPAIPSRTAVSSSSWSSASSKLAMRTRRRGPESSVTSSKEPRRQRGVGMGSQGCQLAGRFELIMQLAAVRH